MALCVCVSEAVKSMLISHIKVLKCIYTIQIHRNILQYRFSGEECLHLIRNSPDL